MPSTSHEGTLSCAFAFRDEFGPQIALSNRRSFFRLALLSADECDSVSQAYRPTFSCAESLRIPFSTSTNSVPTVPHIIKSYQMNLVRFHNCVINNVNSTKYQGETNVDISEPQKIFYVVTKETFLLESSILPSTRLMI